MGNSLANRSPNHLSDNHKFRSSPVGENLNWLRVSIIAWLLVVTEAVAPAQQPGKVPRVGFLITSSVSAIAPRMEAFLHGLSELGYVESQNILLERRYADGKFDRLPALMAELLTLKIDVIVTSGPTATSSAKRSEEHTSELQSPC